MNQNVPIISIRIETNQQTRALSKIKKAKMAPLTLYVASPLATWRGVAEVRWKTRKRKVYL